MIELKHDDNTENNVELSVLCAKVIAAIGLPHLFLNHAQLEATNQATKSRTDNKVSADKQINVKSDYHNPMTLM